MCVDILMPILRSVSFCVNLGDRSISMLLGYEKLPLICLNCGLVGHVVRECLSVPIGTPYDL